MKNGSAGTVGAGSEGEVGWWIVTTACFRGPETFVLLITAAFVWLITTAFF
jgi:hypothetical protein